MTDWTDDQLDWIGGAIELAIAPRRPDGSLRPFITVWVVRAGRGLYVRSWRGPTGRWFTAARRTGAGRIRAGGVEAAVAFQPADDLERRAVDAAYRDKHGRSSDVAAMVGDAAAATTLRLVPR
jgi:hypothetical protein